MDTPTLLLTIDWVFLYFVSFANRRYEELQLLDVCFIAFYSL